MRSPLQQGLSIEVNEREPLTRDRRPLWPRTPLEPISYVEVLTDGAAVRDRNAALSQGWQPADEGEEEIDTDDPDALHGPGLRRVGMCSVTAARCSSQIEAD